MAALMTVEFFEAMQFSPQVTSAPERHMVEILSPHSADESFYESVREWYMGHSLNVGDLEYSKIGLPPMETEQRIIVTADVSWRPRAPDCPVEHSTQCGSIDGSSVYTKANNSAGELVHSDENPMPLKYQ